MKPFTRAGQAACWPAVLFFIASVSAGFAGELNPAPPRITIKASTNGPAQLAFPYPAALQYNVYSAQDATQPFLLDTTSGLLLGPSFQVTNGGPNRLYRVSVTPMSSNDILKATVLNRVTYGPTPEALERINSIGPQAFINEQLAWQQIGEDLDTTAPIVNPPYPPATQPPFTNWIRVSDTGTTTGTNLGIYLSAAGPVYIDNVVLVAGTNADEGPNLLLNGDFEDPVLTNGWFRGSAISANSVITNSPTVDGNAASGTKCLLLIASAGTTTLTSGLWQPFSTSTSAPPGNFTLSFSYLPVVHHGANNLTVRLSGTSTTRSRVSTQGRFSAESA